MSNHWFNLNLHITIVGCGGLGSNTALNLLLSGFSRFHFIAATSPNFMGTIVMAPKVRWSLYDYIENIVHECAHMDLYMKQLIDPMVEGNAELESIFRKKLRPQNAVFHSCYVLYHILIIFNKIKATDIEVLNNDENKIELDLRIDRITESNQLI